MIDDALMLIRPDSNGRPRLPKERKDELRTAVVILRTKEFEDPKAKDYVLTTLTGLIELTATDRSCYSCDFYGKTDGVCSHWKQQVPNEHRESGCGEHQSVGVPF